ncbi:MAG: hypothetical protein M3O34_20080 [Chloroflexota bacterium]|nr:hypothetical protein [Chloroflexota bacterium]
MGGLAASEYADRGDIALRVPRHRARPAGATWAAGAFSVLMIGAVLSPIVQNWRVDPRDDFPLSYYPMFTADRSERVRVTYLRGLDGQGNPIKIRYTFAGTGGLNQVHSQIKKTVRRGGAAELCRSVASGVARRNGRPLADVVTTQIVTGTYKASDYFAGNTTPLAERVHASCQVERDRR